MLTLALTLLSSTQGVYQPESVRHFDAQEQVRMARLTKDAKVVGTGMLLAQAEVPPPVPPAGGPAAAPAKSLQELRDEYRRLDESRPGIVGKIVMLSIGGVLDILGVIFLYDGLVSLAALGGTIFAVLPYVFIVLAVICFAVGIPLTIVGAVGLGKNLKERREIGEQMEAIDAQIKQLESAPPPPPPPSSVENMDKTFQKVPMTTVMTF